MSDTTILLVAAKKLIDTPEKWIKGHYHCNGAYCSVGALNHTDIVLGILENEPYNQAMDLLRSISRQKGQYTIMDFNDDPETTHEDIMELYDLAIKRSKMINAIH